MKELTPYKKELIPHPIYEENNKYVELYYKSYEIAHSKLEYTDWAGGKEILTCMPGSGKVWQWDPCVMCFMTQYSNGTINALNNLDVLYSFRRESDGFMAMAYRLSDGKPAYGERINPPLMALSEWENYLISGDTSRFAKVLDALEGIYSFIENNRRRQSCDLYYFEDTGSSGMDNSPVCGYFSTHLDGSDTCFLDLACQQAISAECLSKITEKLGLLEKSEHYKNEHKRILDLINSFHYSERSGWYFNLFARAERGKRVKFINSKTAAGFWTLLSGAATGKRLENVVSHMLNENEFYTKIPFASLSKDDPNFEETGGYWLGAVWAPTNYAAVRGLVRNGYRKEAREAVIKYNDAIYEVLKNEEHGTIWECYAPEHISPGTTEAMGLSCADFVGWSGIGPISFFIENVIGLNFRADLNEVSVHIESEQRAGLENMLFNGAKMGVVYEKQPSGKVKLSVKCEKPFTLKVYKNEDEEPAVLSIGTGEYEYEI